MNPLIWLQNTVRNQARGSLLGRMFQQKDVNKQLQSLRIVTATRMTEQDFWRNSALGRSLKLWRSNKQISTDIHFENKEGLPKIYNAHLLNPGTADALLFIHDDIWLDDPEWLPKIMAGLRRFDIVGVAGNTEIAPRQPAWCYRTLENGQFTSFESSVLSGSVGHGPLPNGQVSVFGPSPAACRLMDGLFLAVRSSVVHRSRLFFDEQFDFHFYDLDFCRSAKRLGLSLGTWPISLTHQSGGAFASDSWRTSYAHYLDKWKS